MAESEHMTENLVQAPASGQSTGQLRQLLRQQESVRAVVETISGELELQPLLESILRHACELIGAEHGTIGLVDPARDLKPEPDELAKINALHHRLGSYT